MPQASTDRLLRIAVTGSTGLVGSSLCQTMHQQGRDVRPIVRRSTGRANEIRWDTTSQTFDTDALAPCDAVVHLAGENIMGRWSDEKKQRLRDSRVESTRALASTLASLPSGPRTFVVASAIGFYGDTGQSDARTEDDAPGTGFLADVCTQWEAAAEPARLAGIRVVHARIGIVLSPNGGALRQMLTPFRLGLGGRVGDGRQWMSWIGLHDLVRILIHCIDTPSIAGPVNAVAPTPATNNSFTQSLGRVLNRPTILPVPALVPRLLFGRECADALVLGSIRVFPKRMIDSGFTFEFNDLDQAIRHELHQR